MSLGLLEFVGVSQSFPTSALLMFGVRELFAVENRSVHYRMFNSCLALTP